MRKKSKIILLKKLVIIHFMLLFMFSLINAQEPSLSGVVFDELGEPVIGATIVIKGTGNGTVTDFDGRFSIKAKSNDVIVISYVGYEQQEISVKGKTNIEVRLSTDTKTLSELVVIGYGTVTKKDLTGATSSIKGSDITQIPVATAAQALSGKLAGVNVTSSSGAPGADINILVRGGTSITQDVKPLYIVDGFQMDDGLRNIDINDIESIDVMKDASSTAIYGARGSNGVVLITTKSGKEGKTRVSYNSYVSFESLSNKLKMLDVKDYVRYQYEYQVLRNQEASWATMFGGNIMDLNFYSGAYDRISREYGSRQGIDWQDIVFGGTVLTQNHNASISGGNNKTNFILSYNLTNQDGILAKTGYEKNNFRIKMNHELFKGVRLDVSTNLNTSKIDGGGSFSGLKQTALQPPTGGILFDNDEMVNTDVRDQMMIYESAYDIN